MRNYTSKRDGKLPLAKTGGKMATVLKLEDLREDAGQRCAEFLRAHYKSPLQKNIANDLRCEPRTAKDWLNGKLPGSTHLLGLFCRFGQPFYDYVVGPAVGWHGEQAMREELEKSIRRTEELTRRLELHGVPPRTVEGEGPALAGSSIDQRPMALRLPELSDRASSDSRSSFRKDEE